MRSLHHLAPRMGSRQYDFDLKAQNSLHLAVTQGHLKVVRYLIDKCGFDPKLPDLVGACMHAYIHTYVCTCVREVTCQKRHMTLHTVCQEVNAWCRWKAQFLCSPESAVLPCVTAVAPCVTMVSPCVTVVSPCVTVIGVGPCVTVVMAQASLRFPCSAVI